MKIRMKKTVQGSLDGVTVHELVSGEEYDTIDSARGVRLAHYHVHQGVAELSPVDPVIAMPRVARKVRRQK